MNGPKLVVVKRDTRNPPLKVLRVEPELKGVKRDIVEITRRGVVKVHRGSRRIGNRKEVE